jgi:hypothetical protein
MTTAVATRTTRHVYPPGLFESGARAGSDIDPDAARRMETLMRHFSVERKRVAEAQGRRRLFGDTGPIGRVKTYLNKINDGNFVVASHGIFRVLVDDSLVPVERVFDTIMSYAFRDQGRSRLFARVCADLAGLYPSLRTHVDARIRQTHADVARDGAAATAVPDAGTEYGAYLAYAERKRTACGCFAFVGHLHDAGVVDAGLLAAHWDTVCTEVDDALRGMTVATVDAGDGDGGRDNDNDNGSGNERNLSVYVDCLKTMIVEGHGWSSGLRQTESGRAVVARLRAVLAPYHPGASRPPAIPGRVWFGLVDLRERVQ